MIGFIVCCRCEELTDHWVVWGASEVEEVYYFCGNACLAAWLASNPEVEWPVNLPLDPI
jgi:hypothetical protein